MMRFGADEWAGGYFPAYEIGAGLHSVCGFLAHRTLRIFIEAASDS